MACLRYQIGDRLVATRAFELHAAVRTGAHGFRRDVAAFAVPTGAPPAAGARFAETATAFARLVHPHVLTVDDVCVDRGRTWAVTRPVAGAPLSCLLDVPASRARALRVDVVVHLVRRVAEAAHAITVLGGGSLLGGISADGIWLERSGAPILLPVVQRCASGAPADHAAPTKAHDAADGPSDVYSVALLLWDLLALGRARGPGAASDPTTEAPFSGDHALAQLVQRALSPRVAERPRDLLALRDELAGLPIPPPPEEDEPITLIAAARGPGGEESSEPRTLELGTPGDTGLARAREALRPMPAPVRLLAAAAVVSRESADTVPERRVHPTVRSITPSLRVIGQDSVPRVLPLNHGANRWVVGRSRSADLVILDLDMSREHFEIVRGENGEYRLFDLGSKNGTFLNAVRADDRALKSGDRLRAGSTELRFE